MAGNSELPSDDGEDLSNMSENEVEKCPMCDEVLEPGALDGNWKEFECPGCGLTVLRPVVSDHSEGVSVEDLENITSFSDKSNEE